ncbi:glycoside hydrolase superfamily [Trichophaea hybrida]|nr:glycoside hydrolase superfamily [Trichophaea hybrida]
MRYRYHDERQKLLAGVGIPPPEPNFRCRGTRRAGILVVIFVMGALLYLGSKVPPEYPVADESEHWKSEGWFPSPRGGTVKNWEESYRKAAELVGKMSLLEKVNITTGIGWQQGLCVGNTGPAINVGFPSLCLQDGPLGLRFADHATAWPAALTVGATWNRELAFKRGAGHGEEARLKGINILLGPSMGPLGRMPAGGRNWEGFGTDPYLQGAAAAETIKGIQSSGVIATAKHFILNEQEHFRQVLEWSESPNHAISSNADDRTMHELYLWPFADSVRAGVASVMCSYNQVNNTYACGNSKTMNGLLKDELGFQGFVQSDWFAVRDGVLSILGGLDMVMPGNVLIEDGGYTLFGANLTSAVMNSTLPVERLNEMALRIVAAWYQLGQDDKSKFPEDKPNFSSWTQKEEDFIYHGAGEGDRGIVNKYVDVQSDHWKVARQVAVEGTVLVKNEGILPLKRGSFKGKHIGIYGEDAGTEDQKGFPNFCVDRGCNKGSLGSGWGSGSVEFPHFHTPLSALKTAFNTSADDIPRFTAITNNQYTSSIVKSAKSQHLCFAFINSDAGEGYIQDPVTGVHGDRMDLYPQNGGDKLVKSVTENCENTIVVVHAVGPVILEEWIDLPGIQAVVLAHLPGQESGKALVEILFGDTNPSGKLPYTIGKSLKDYGPGAEVIYHPNALTPQQTFNEGLEIDYRYFDKHSITPRFEFGFGLSYSTFAIKSPRLTQKLPKAPFPSPRPKMLPPPSIPASPLPPFSSVLFPEGFKKVLHYIYPYVSRPSDIFRPSPIHYPPDYDRKRPLSPAGGGEGGNPSLWDVVAELEVTVRNTGDVEGAEVAQLYVGFPEVEGINFPVRVLRGFEKVFLKAGQEKKVVFEIKRRELSYWDVIAQNWRMPTEGNFTIWVGSSSRNLPVEINF